MAARFSASNSDVRRAAKTYNAKKLALSQRLSDGGVESGETGGDVLPEMDAQGAAVAFGKHLKVAASFCRFHHAKGVLLPRHGKIGGVVTCDLEEDARIWSALVGLPGGMEEARAEAEASGYMGFIADEMANRLEFRFVSGVTIQVAQHGEVISLL